MSSASSTPATSSPDAGSLQASSFAARAESSSVPMSSFAASSSSSAAHISSFAPSSSSSGIPESGFAAAASYSSCFAASSSSLMASSSSSSCFAATSSSSSSSSSVRPTPVTLQASPPALQQAPEETIPPSQLSLCAASASVFPVSQVLPAENEQLPLSQGSPAMDFSACNDQSAFPHEASAPMHWVGHLRYFFFFYDRLTPEERVQFRESFSDVKNMPLPKGMYEMSRQMLADEASPEAKGALERKEARDSFIAYLASKAPFSDGLVARLDSLLERFIKPELRASVIAEIKNSGLFRVDVHTLEQIGPHLEGLSAEAVAQIPDFCKFYERQSFPFDARPSFFANCLKGVRECLAGRSLEDLHKSLAMYVASQLTSPERERVAANETSVVDNTPVISFLNRRCPPPPNEHVLRMGLAVRDAWTHLSLADIITRYAQNPDMLQEFCRSVAEHGGTEWKEDFDTQEWALCRRAMNSSKLTCQSHNERDGGPHEHFKRFAILILILVGRQRASFDLFFSAAKLEDCSLSSPPAVIAINEALNNIGHEEDMRRNLHAVLFAKDGPRFPPAEPQKRKPRKTSSAKPVVQKAKARATPSVASASSSSSAAPVKRISTRSRASTESSDPLFAANIAAFGLSSSSSSSSSSASLSGSLASFNVSSASSSSSSSSSNSLSSSSSLSSTRSAASVTSACTIVSLLDCPDSPDFGPWLDEGRVSPPPLEADPESKVSKGSKRHEEEAPDDEPVPKRVKEPAEEDTAVARMASALLAKQTEPSDVIVIPDDDSQEEEEDDDAPGPAPQLAAIDTTPTLEQFFIQVRWNAPTFVHAKKRLGIKRDADYEEYLRYRYWCTLGTRPLEGFFKEYARKFGAAAFDAAMKRKAPDTTALEAKFGSKQNNKKTESDDETESEYEEEEEDDEKDEDF